jgi:hypothetical protein
VKGTPVIPKEPFIYEKRPEGPYSLGLLLKETFGTVLQYLP